MTARKTAGRQRREKGEGSIRERPERSPATRFEGRLTIPETGKRQSFYGPTLDAVRDAMRAFWVEHQRGTAPRALSKLTVAEYLEHWMENTAVARFEPNVREIQISILRNHVIPAIGKIELAKLTQDQVEAFLRSRLKPCGPQGKPLARSTIRHLHWILSGAFQDGVKKGLMDNNPARGIEHPRVAPHQPVFLTAAQAQTLLGAIPSHPMGTIFAVCIGAGLRVNETLGICQDDLDFATGDLVLSHQLKRQERGWVIASTKNNSVRTVTLPAMVLALVRQHRAAQQAEDLRTPPPAAWAKLLFRHPGLGTPYHRGEIGRGLDAFTESLGLPRLIPHELRHTAASLLLRNGANLKEVAEFLGHKSVSTTAEFYAHLYPDQSRRTAARLTEMLTPVALQTPENPSAGAEKSS